MEEELTQVTSNYLYCRERTSALDRTPQINHRSAAVMLRSQKLLLLNRPML